MHAKLFWSLQKRRLYGKRLKELAEIRHKVDNLHLKDKSSAFNTSRVEAIELTKFI